MYLAYLVAALFIAAYYGLQKFVSPTKKLQALSSKKSAANLADGTNRIPVWGFVIVVAVALAARILAGCIFKGHPTDMSCWTAWGNKVLNDGPGHLYSPGYFCDYPPGYMAVLGFFAWLNKAFGLSGNATQLMFKMPGILADLGLIITAFVLGSKYVNKRTGMFLGIILAINPMLFVNSAAWGQIESVLALFLILAMYQLYKKNFIKSGVLYVIAVLIKPQALMVGPVFLFAFLASKDWKMILKMIGIGVVMVFAFVVMFNYDVWATDKFSGFGRFIAAFNPMWLIKKYMSTLGSYKYFTVNAFNLYAAIKLNWVAFKSVAVPETVLNIINNVLILAAVGASLLMFIKIKSPSGKIFIPSFFIIGFLFTFGFKMHERYIVTPVLFLIFEYIFSKNKRILHSFALMSGIAAINVQGVLFLTHRDITSYGAIWFASILEVLIFIIVAAVILHDYILYPECSCAAEGNAAVKRETPFDRIFKKAKSVWFGALSKAERAVYSHTSQSIKPGHRSEKLVKIDYLILSVIVVLYSVVAYVNLGSVHNPQTFYKPAAANERVNINFAAPEQIDTITYYLGIGDVGKKPSMKLSYSDDGVNWTDMSAECQLKAVFRWESVKLSSPVTARYIRGTVTSADYRMFELAFWRADGSRINIGSITGPGDCRNIADEQEYAQYKSSFMNSTYFDEIYHPRTAYEHLHMMPYYETTHPPLGKLIMSVGIAIFGMTPFGWRVMGTLFGIIMLPLMYIMLKKLFERTRYSVLGTLIFAFDFMHFSLTRMGTIDSYPVTFIIAMYMFMFLFGKRVLSIVKNNPEELSNRKTLRRLMVILGLSGLMFGLGAASKWISIYAGAGLAVELLLIFIGMYITAPKDMRREITKFVLISCAWCVLTFVAVPVVIYTLAYLPISMVDGYPNVVKCMLDNQKYMFNYHSDLQATHPYSSNWYQWPIDYRPLWAYSAPEETVGKSMIGCISIFGNPLIFWASIAAFVYTGIVGIIKRDKKVLFLMVGLLAQFVPWMLIKRCVFIYHFFASTPFLIIMIVYSFKDLEERFGWFKHISNAFVVLCGLLFAAFYPVLSGLPISKTYSDTWLKWIKTWVFHNRAS